MKEVIPPIDKNRIEKELTTDKFLRKTNNGSNLLYIVTHHDSPNTMLEIGRLRELTFRAAGGGTGEETDIDSYDTIENPYKQLLVWDPQQKEILGGYRYMLCGDLKPKSDGNFDLATTKLFKFSTEFNDHYLPFMIELGRSFVQPAYQMANKNKKSLYALDNLWDGLGALHVIYPEYKYFFGKVTMYTSYNIEARDLILYFLDKHFKGENSLIRPYNPIKIDLDNKLLKSILVSNDIQEDMKILSQAVRARGEVIPPLINAYINLSKTLKCFGTVLNDHFGDVEETAILLTISDMYPSKIERHVNTFKKF